MKAIYGLFPDPDSAQSAVDELRRTGVDDASITVITSQPYEEYEFSHRKSQTWLFWIAAGGGLLGLGSGLILAYVTESLWPIVTGGMPIFAWWPNIIVLFELTMLGAIIATVLSLLITTELPTRKVKLYDPAVSEGKILVGVEQPSADALPKLQRVLRDAKTVR
jgi:hypothetical protein